MMAEPKVDDNHRPTPDEAREVLAQSQKEQVESCRQEIDTVLEKHNCRFEAAMLVTARGNIPQVQIVANG